MKEKLTILFIAIFVSLFSFSQTTDKTQDSEKKGIVRNKSLSFGAKLNTNGWGILGAYTRSISFNRDRLFYFEFLEHKHPKELKKPNDFGIGLTGYTPKPIIFGKQNNFYSLHVGYGAKRFIGDKAEKSGVEVNFSYVVGPSLGLLKPYYVDIIFLVERDGQLEAEPRPLKYSEENAEVFLNPEAIYGATGFSKGLNEIKFVPGIFAKAGFNFDWASYDEFVKALEVGIGADVYPKRIPIMIAERNNPYFVYLYASIQIGKNW